MTELKPCPFCGKSEHLEILKIEDSKHPKHYKVTCDITSGGCGGIGGYRFSNQEAIEAWNTRFEPTCGEPRGFIECDEDNFGNPSFAELWCEYCDIELDHEWKHCPSCGRRVIEE